jgi:hypothetical protein
VATVTLRLRLESPLVRRMPTPGDLAAARSRGSRPVAHSGSLHHSIARPSPFDLKKAYTDALPFDQSNTGAAQPASLAVLRRSWLDRPGG